MRGRAAALIRAITSSAAALTRETWANESAGRVIGRGAVGTAPIRSRGSSMYPGCISCCTCISSQSIWSYASSTSSRSTAWAAISSIIRKGEVMSADGMWWMRRPSRSAIPGAPPITTTGTRSAFALPRAAMVARMPTP